MLEWFFGLFKKQPEEPLELTEIVDLVKTDLIPWTPYRYKTNFHNHYKMDDFYLYNDEQLKAHEKRFGMDAIWNYNYQGDRSRQSANAKRVLKKQNEKRYGPRKNKRF